MLKIKCNEFRTPTWFGREALSNSEKTFEKSAILTRNFIFCWYFSGGINLIFPFFLFFLLGGISGYLPYFWLESNKLEVLKVHQEIVQGEIEHSFGYSGLITVVSEVKVQHVMNFTGRYARMDRPGRTVAWQQSPWRWTCRASPVLQQGCLHQAVARCTHPLFFAPCRFQH